MKRSELFAARAKSIDMFEESIGFSMDKKGNASNKSVLGALLSLIVIVISTTYAVKRYGVMVNFEDTVHSQVEEINIYD